MDSINIIKSNGVNKNSLNLIVIGALVFYPALTKASDVRGFYPKLKTFSLTYQDKEFSVGPDTLETWKKPITKAATSEIFYQAPKISNLLDNFSGQAAQSSRPENLYLNYDPGLVYDYINNLSEHINQAAVEPKLSIENNRAADFLPAQTGQTLDVYASTLKALWALENNQPTSTLEIFTDQPKKNLGNTNNLGINELVSRGISSFKGSPKNRRHNIATGIEKFKGLIIPRGAEFSFDDNLGPVTAEAGFLPELVIKGKQGTIPELGGGLCQVSTTTFRAAMAAGVPITARRNHAYAVQYYSPQGTDATIYPGSADLKFINNTPGAILIWPYETDTNTLVYDFYGTNDGRKVTLEKPVVYDRKPDGSMKATWTREVFNNGTTTTSTFKSVYQPPALFHKTEEFVKATSTKTSLQAPPKVQ